MAPRAFDRLRLWLSDKLFPHAAFLKDAPIDALFKRGLEHMQLRGEVTEPYREVGAVYIAVSIISQSLASVDWGVFRNGEELEEHPVYGLIARPNATQVGSQLIEATSVYLELKGEGFWWYDQEAGQAPDGRGAFPRRIRLIPPGDMKEKSDSEGGIDHWKLERQGKGRRIETEELSHFKFFNPENPLRGLAPLTAAKQSYNLNWKNQRLQERFYTQGGFPPFYVRVPEEAGQLDRKERRVVREQFRQNYMGWSNAWKPPFLFGGAKLESIGINSRDSEFIATNKLSTYDILAVFQVPPFVAGYPEQREERAVEEKRSFWTRTIRNKGDLLQEVINATLMARWFPGDTFKFKWQSKFAEALPEDVRDNIESAHKLWQMMVPAKLAFELFNIDISTKDAPYLEEGWASPMLLPANEVLAGGGGLLGAGLSQEAAVLLTLLGGKGKQSGPVALPAAGRLAALPSAGNGHRSGWPTTPKLREALWRGIIDKTDKVERRFLGDYRSFLRWLRDETLRGMGQIIQERAGGLRAALRLIARDIGDQALPSATLIERKVVELTSPDIAAALQEGFTSVLAEVNVDITFSLLDPKVIELVSARTVKIKGASKTVADRMRFQLSEGIEAGEAIAQLEDRIRAVHNLAWRGQAKAVARTETAAGFSGSRELAQQEAGINGREWLTARDADVRDSHAGLDGNIIMFGDTFANGLKHPLDPDGLPGEVINCRCVALSVMLETGN